MISLFCVVSAGLEKYFRPAEQGRRRLRTMKESGEIWDGESHSAPSLSIKGHLTTLKALASRGADVLRPVPVLRVFVLAYESWQLRRTQQRAADACIDDLPEFVDVLTLSLQAGISFDAALEAYGERFDTVFSHEIRRALQSYRLGMQTRSRALESICERLPDDAVLRLITALNQALALGAPLLATLGTLGFELRSYRKARLEERIAKTPVKLLLPLGLCVLPAVLILLMGPLMMQVMSGLSV
jgi:tight adherence protein C